MIKNNYLNNSTLLFSIMLQTAFNDKENIQESTSFIFQI